MSITIIVKNPANMELSFRTAVPLESTVGDVKSTLQRVYAGNPAPSQQKLIFGGRLLTNDAEKVSTILSNRDISVPQTFHLVVSSGASAAGSRAHGPSFTPRRGTPPRAQTPMAAYPPPAAAPYDYPGVRAMPPAGAPVHPHGAAPAAPPQNPPVAVIRVNIGLIFKLSLVVFVLAQGGETDRAIMLIIGAFTLYLYLTGVFGGGGVGGNAAAADAANGAPPAAPSASVPQAGPFHELQDFFIPLVLSLLPSWMPPPRVAHAPPAAPIPAEGAVPAGDGAQ